MNRNSLYIIPLLLCAGEVKAQPAATQPTTQPAGVTEAAPTSQPAALPETTEAAPAEVPQQEHEAEMAQSDLNKGVELVRHGDFSLRFGGLIQVQAAFAAGQDVAIANEDAADTEGFRIRRARIGVAGDLVRDVDYSLEIDLKDTVMAGAGGDQGSEILDAKISWQRFPWARVTLGTGKLPFSAYAMESSSRLTMIERPLFNALLAPDYRVGLTISGGWRGLQYAAGLYNGSEGITSGNRLAGIAGLGRLQYHVVRSPGRGLNLSFGGAYMGDNTPSITVHRVSGNLNVSFYGARLFGELIWRTTMPLDQPGGVPEAGGVKNLGVAGDLSIFIYKDLIQLAGRYEYFKDNQDLATYGEQQLLTVGANIYAYGDNLKLQINYVRRDELEGPEVANDMGFAQLQAMF